jgi:hypothetical protein
MNKCTAALLLFILVGTGANIFATKVRAMGGDERDDPKTQKVEVNGKVRMVGNSPMTFLVISGEDREWYVEPEEQEKLMHLQQQAVTVKASEYYRDRVFANGSPAGRHYYLKNIVIISPKQ